MKNLNKDKKKEFKVFKKLELEPGERPIFKVSNSFLLIFSTAILFTLTGIWQLVVISGFFGGFFIKRAKNAAYIGFLSVFSAWFTLFLSYSLLTDMGRFFNYWLIETLGSLINWSSLLMILCSLAGGFFGALGGINGVYLARIYYRRTELDHKEAVDN